MASTLLFLRHRKLSFIIVLTGFLSSLLAEAHQYADFLLKAASEIYKQSRDEGNLGYLGNLHLCIASLSNLFAININLFGSIF